MILWSFPSAGSQSSPVRIVVPALIVQFLTGVPTREIRWTLKFLLCKNVWYFHSGKQKKSLLEILEKYLYITYLGLYIMLFGIHLSSPKEKISLAIWKNLLQKLWWRCDNYLPWGTLPSIWRRYWIHWKYFSPMLFCFSWNIFASVHSICFFGFWASPAC